MRTEGRIAGEIRSLETNLDNRVYTTLAEITTVRSVIKALKWVLNNEART